ncbi:MAG: hypothetical protein ACKV2O_25275 [Acidimicrobiales bacterium]
MAHRIRPLVHVAVVGVLALAAAACSGDDATDGDTATEDTQDAIEIPASSTAGADGSTTVSDGSGGGTATSADTTAGGSGTTTDDSSATSTGPGASTTTTGTAAASETTVSLKEWSLTPAATTFKAGPITFTITNDGSSTHEFVVIKGTYETMPQSSIGAVLEDQLPANAVIGRVDSLRSGEKGVLSANFAAGPYTLLCNIAVGPNSHAGKGQRQNITIA